MGFAQVPCRVRRTRARRYDANLDLDLRLRLVSQRDQQHRLGQAAGHGVHVVDNIVM